MSDTKEEIPDIIDWSEISKESRDAWIAVSLEYDWINIENSRTWISLDTIAVLYFKLCAIRDTPERFPKGKWASLHALHDVIQQEIKKTEPR